MRETSSHFITDMAVTNRGKTTCQVAGWPSVALRGNATMVACVVGQQLPNCGGPVSEDDIDRPAPVRTGSKAPAFVLDPGEYAPFSLVWHGVTCLLPAYRAEVALSGDPRVLSVVFPTDTNPCVEAAPNDPTAGRTPVLVTPLGAPETG